jgi:hypothetical protein
MGQPFLFMAKILGSDSGAPFSFLHRGLTRSLPGIKAPQVLHAWFRIIVVHPIVLIYGYNKFSLQKRNN